MPYPYEANIRMYHHDDMDPALEKCHERADKYEQDKSDGEYI